MLPVNIWYDDRNMSQAFDFTFYDDYVYVFIGFLDGNYQITLIASNILGSLNESLKIAVQMPVIGLSLDKASYYTQLGKGLTFVASANGTDVHYDWDMGDHQSFTDAGMLYGLWNI